MARTIPTDTYELVLAAIARFPDEYRPNETRYLSASIRDELLSHGQAVRSNEPVENQLLSLHEGNIARYRLRPREFQAWRAVWK